MIVWELLRKLRASLKHFLELEERMMDLKTLRVEYIIHDAYLLKHVCIERRDSKLKLATDSDWRLPIYSVMAKPSVGVMRCFVLAILVFSTIVMSSLVHENEAGSVDWFVLGRALID